MKPKQQINFTQMSFCGRKHEISEAKYNPKMVSYLLSKCRNRNAFFATLTEFRKFIS